MRFPKSIVMAACIGCCASAWADGLPTIVTYELRRQRQEARASARDPRLFWIRQVATRLEDKVVSFSTALKQPAVVRISFVVARDGHLVSKEIAASSGNETADKAAIAMLDRAQPFPPMPASMSDAELSFSLPVRFR